MSAECPVAIVGIGCKFPGGSETKELYYEFLRNKGDGMVEPPKDRWNHDEWMGRKDEPGKYCSSKGGFIEGIDLFDPLEFGISMKEAQHLDPSLRHTLEVSHMALHDSGIDYRGSNTGVYFAQLLVSTDELDDDRYEIDSHNGVGKCIAIRANRVSFTFDLKGPSLTLDTACSSSGTAMHLALSAIRLGEIDQALVIGASTMINPEHTVSFSKLGVLSPTGSCKSFDAAADGYARAEGFAAVLIKKLDDAIRDGDTIYSVIKGSAINANGKGKSLTMPEADRQGETIKTAYRHARRDPAEAFFVELHATGTLVGDPIEVNGAGKIFSQGRDQKKTLRVGSVKGNIGHSEGCSFLASLIKVSLMLHNKEIIPNYRFNNPNPKIDFVKGKMRVQTELEKLTAEMAGKDGKWVTSVSSYGVGGANAHVVLETFESAGQLALPAPETETTVAKPIYLFSVGTLTEASIVRWQETLSQAFQGVNTPKTLRSLSRELARQARAYPYRSFAIGSSLSPEIKFSKPALVSSNANPKLCLVFAGQGPQHIFMGRQLSEAYPAFLAAIQANDDVLVKKYGQESFVKRSGLFIPGTEATLAANGVWAVKDVVMSLVFFQTALVDLIKSLGIEYEYVVGHSIGEIAMGYASGHYDRETAVGIAVARAAAMTKAEGNGSMVALGVGVQKAKLLIKKVLEKAGVKDGLWVAGINSPKAVTLAGKTELVDAMVELAADPADKVFAAKLRVTCAFHTPLMEPQESVFRELMQSAIKKTDRKPTARVMSTVDGKWLERELDVDYCWDNIRKPVLFGTAVNKIVKDVDDILFLEVAPHPVLKSYVEEIGGTPVSLVKRPNPKVPAQNTGEHYQFLEGIGNLLSGGFKRVDFSRFFATPDGQTTFEKVKLPAYPYNKTSCWSESAEGRSLRLKEKSRPVAPAHFRLSVDTHPSLTGHVVMDAVLYPGSGYIEAILENGAMVVKDFAVHKPLVLAAHAADPTHAGCIISGNRFEFRASTSNTFVNGDVVLDTCYASGTFYKENPAFDEARPKTFDVNEALSRAVGSITGDEFYDAIPSAYGYKEHFRDYLKEVFEVVDEESWGDKAYLTRLEIPAGTPDVFDDGWVIHPGVLDSITQCGLAMFISIITKTFDFNGTFLPVKMDALKRWDSRDAPSLNAELRAGPIWTYYQTRIWGPKGPFVADYIICNAQGRVLFTIEGFEIALAPEAEPVVIDDSSVQERLTTVWQPKTFSIGDYTLPAVSKSASSSEYLAVVIEEILAKARTSGRHVVRAIDLDEGSVLAEAADSVITKALAETHLSVEYFCAGETAEKADAKTGAMSYQHARSCIADVVRFVDGPEVPLRSFDIVLRKLALSQVPQKLEYLTNLLVDSGVLALVVSDEAVANSDADAESFANISLDELLKRIRPLCSGDVQAQTLSTRETVIVARSLGSSSVDVESDKQVIVFHMEHGNEGQLVDLVKGLSGDVELWVAGNDDAAGIGALGVAGCIAAESPDYVVRSILFEDHSLAPKERESWVHALRRQGHLVEQHLKISKNGDIYVRRLVETGLELKEYEIPALVARTTSGQVALSASFPPALGATDVEILVEAIGLDDVTGSRPATFVGHIVTVGTSVNTVSIGAKVVVTASRPFSDKIVIGQDNVVQLKADDNVYDIAALPLAITSAWIGIHGKLSKDSVVLIHAACSRAGFGALQLCRRAGARVFCTVATKSEAQYLTSELNVDENSIALNYAVDECLAIAKKWLRKSRSTGFDVIFNADGQQTLATGVHLLTAVGTFVHNKRSTEAVILPPGAPAVQIVDVPALIKSYPAKLASYIAEVLAEHRTQPFALPQAIQSIATFGETATTGHAFETLILSLKPAPSVRVDPYAQLFNPRKSYILVGGSSELGVRIATWMADHGARHIFLTSRRGEKALTKVDGLYIRHLHQRGVNLQVMAANAVSKRDMTAVIESARSAGPIGGVFLMTVVLRDAAFTNLSQESFDDVYESKVECLNVLLSLAHPAEMDFLLLFSTIGSVFGNAGQAAYCASQLYLDRIADVLPNTISMSFPPITDSGIFKRLVMATKGRANTGQLTKTGMTTAQVCNFIGDCLVRTVAHYVPMLAVQDVPDTFPTCEPLLYEHLLPSKFLNVGGQGNKGDVGETPATLLAALLGMSADQITENALITSFGLDSLAATRFSHQLKANFKIQVSQIELLGSMTVGILNEMIRKVGASAAGGQSSSAVDDGSSKYGQPLLANLNDHLAYDEPYTTDASPHQYRIWLAQAEYDNARKRSASHIDPLMSRFGATQWDTHEGYFVTVQTDSDLDIDRMRKAFQEVVQRHGALRTTFTWSEELGKLVQTIHPTVDFEPRLIDLSGESEPEKKAFDMACAENREPSFKLDQLPLLSATMYRLGGGAYSFSVIIHHIIIDEASLGMFFYELFALYLHGIGSLSPMSYHYSDFSDWFIRTADRRAELRDSQLQYWTQTLSDVQPLHLTLAKPSDVERCSVTQIEGSIDPEALAQYHKLITAASVTNFAGFFAVYNVLLHKYSSQKNFVVGTAVTQRSLPQLQDVMGFFANILPIKTVIDEDQTFLEYLASFKAVLMDSLAHDDVTYEDIVAQGKTSALDRGYFKHLFAPGGFNLNMIKEFETNNMRTNSILPLPNGEEKYELLLTAHTKTGNVVLRFDNFLYSEDSARQLLDAYIGLIGTLGMAPNTKIRDVSAVSRTEELRLVKELSSSGPVAPLESLVHGLVERQAELTPQLPAVEFEDKVMTYAELNRKANRIAYSLMHEGVGPDSVVAICFDRGIHQILAILAVLKAGGAFVPLDPDDPTLRKEMIIMDCGAKVLLTTQSHRRAFDKSIASKVIVAYIDDPTYEKRLNRFDDANPSIQSLTPSNLAYIMFTSGSTGKPKGVMIEHRSIANLVQHSSAYGYKHGARVLSSLAYTFDPFVIDVFGVKELVLGDIGKALKTLNVNVLHVTPSILAVVPLEQYPALETVVVAGEALGKKLIEDWSKRVKFMNMYGPTEAAVDCVSCHVTSSDVAGVIGRPLPNCRVYILDDHMRPAPLGVEGELYIGGIQLARGYLNRPDLTEVSFIPNPFVPGERLYKTGDVALYRPDGNIEYRGRKDRQIKLRGQRIELGEVEDVIVKYPAVQRAAVVIREIHDEPAIVAFIEFKNAVAADHVEEEKEALKLHVSERLPRFMYPSLIAVLPALPTSRSGKIDRKALGELDLQPFAPDLSHDMGVPQSEVETELLNIFANLLKVDANSFGVTHDLFSVGMNSLMAVQAAGVISKTFNVHMGLNNMYLRPTVRELATLVIDAMGQDQRQILDAEDADNDFLIEFLPIKKKGILPRIFLVHDVTGMATPFMRLGAYMPNEMYAIGDRDFGNATGFQSIEAMADHYISLIKTVQPEGPYLIAGYSLGGIVALCMASKLTNAGEKVKHLVLFDPIFIPTRERQSLKSTDWTTRAIERISENFPEIGEKWKSKLRIEIRKNLDAMWDYEAPHYDEPTTLVVPKDRSWYRTGHASDFDTGIDDRNGWDYRLSKLDMKVASGRHDTMFTPAHVKILAGVFKEILAALPADELSSSAITPAKQNGSAKSNGHAGNGHAH
ncbi:PKS/NRPS enzyme [Gelatoporia subvermispora B]|uniref:PKS/NRPS enzyme n=1 Tax=Ceriporiopsis subvermispora (strain B) TaxID=914234 RepID=M2PA23_CERS8|nr:PKS/NRPS enzyme [Gelatoporia subvermispora B]